MSQTMPEYAAESAPAWGHSPEAEQAVIGGLLLDNSAWENVADLLAPRDFFQTDHRILFEHTGKLLESGQPVDALTLAESLQRVGKLDEAGGQAYVGALALNTPSAANVRRYAEIVRERSLLRTLFAEAQAVAEAVRRPGAKSARELLDMAQARFMALGERSAAGRDFQTTSEVMATVAAFVDEQHERYKRLGDDAAVTGVPTGFADLDRMTSGFQPDQLVIIAARPSMGKSALTLNICENAARLGHVPLFFSLEMGNREQGVRLLASRSGLNTQRLFSGRINDEHWPRVVNALGDLSEHVPILFNESPYVTVQEIRSLARRARRSQPRLSMIVVDYLQLMVAGVSEANRANQVAEISRGLKLLAKELHVPVVALSQLNRALESRADKRPLLSDLRDSGAIEQDADMVLFIYRDEFYHPETPRKGIAEIIVAKQRNGPVGKIDLVFKKDNTRFVDYFAGGGV